MPASGSAAVQISAGGIQLVVEPGAPVGGDLDDAGKPDQVVARTLVGFEQIAQAQPPDLQRGRLRGGGMGVVGLEIAQRVAAVDAVAGGDLDRAGLTHRRRQIDHRVARTLLQVERGRVIGLAGDGEGGPVLEHTGRRGQREPAGRQQVAVDRHLGYSPGMRTQFRGSRTHQRFHPAILLLEVLGAQEHALLPDNPVGPRHDIAPLGIGPLGAAPLPVMRSVPAPTSRRARARRRVRRPCRKRCRNRRLAPGRCGHTAPRRLPRHRPCAAEG